MGSNTTPDLETGWRAQTPADDTVLRQVALSQASSWRSVATAERGRLTQDDRFVAADLGRPSGLFNSAILLQPLHGRELTEVLDTIERFYAAGGSGVAMLWSLWPTPDLHRRGWDLEGHPPLLVRGASMPVDHRVPEELEIVEVNDRGGLEDWCALAVDGYPFRELKPYEPGTLLHADILADDRWRLLVGLVDGRPACIGSQFVEHGLNMLFLAVTAPGFRGSGYYRAMATHRLADQPDLLAAAVVSDLSRPVLVHQLGFLAITRLTLWTRSRP